MESTPKRGGRKTPRLIQHANCRWCRQANYTEPSSHPTNSCPLRQTLISKNDPLAPVVSKEDLLRHTSDEKLTSSATIGDADKPKIVKPSTKPHDVSPEHGNIHGEKTSKSAVDTADNSLVVDAKKQHHSESDNGLEEEVAGVDEEKVGQEQDDA